MAQTFNNGENLGSIRVKLNDNAGEINGKANLTGGNTFSGNQNIDVADGQYGIIMFDSGKGAMQFFDSAWFQGFRQNSLELTTSGNAKITLRYNDSDGVTIDDNFNWKGQNWTSAWTSYTPVFSGSGGGTPSSTDTAGSYKIIGKTCHVFFTGSCNKNTLSGRPRLSLPITPLRDGSECVVPAILGGIGDRLSTQLGDAVLSGGGVEWLSGIGTAGDWSSYPSTVYVRGTFSYELA